MVTDFKKYMDSVGGISTSPEIENKHPIITIIKDPSELDGGDIDRNNDTPTLDSLDSHIDNSDYIDIIDLSKKMKIRVVDLISMLVNHDECSIKQPSDVDYVASGIVDNTPNTTITFENDTGRGQNDSSFVVEDAPKDRKTGFEIAENIFKSMMNNKNVDRDAILSAFERVADITRSTAMTYFERLVKKYNKDIPNELDSVEHSDNDNTDDSKQTQFGSRGGSDIDDNDDHTETLHSGVVSDIDDIVSDVREYRKDRDGIIRKIDGARLVYKRRMDDGKFEELWIYNIGNTFNTELGIRKKILSGTDIPKGETETEDGGQYYTISTMGNAQLINIFGLSN